MHWIVNIMIADALAPKEARASASHDIDYVV